MKTTNQCGVSSTRPGAIGAMRKTKKISIKPEWDEIEKARLTAEEFFNSQNLSAECSYRIIMTLSELIENGIKYGHFQKTAAKLNANITLLADSVIIEVTHPIGEPSSTNLKKLDSIIQRIRSYQDPFEAYVGKLEEVAKRSLDDDESGLGLVRIAHEGGAVIDFIVDEQGLINVSAVLHYE